MANSGTEKVTHIQIVGEVKTVLDKASAKKTSEELKKILELHQKALWEGMDHRGKQAAYEKLFGFSEKDLKRQKFFGSLKETLSGVGNVAKTVAVSLGSSTKNAIGSAMQNVADKVKETTKHFNGFFSAIKRIAVYRAIRWALKEIVQGFQEGIQNAYQWSVITGNQFARSMDMMATSALYLKNSLGAMTMPLVNVLAPILDALVDKFVALINVVNQFIATITGATSWTRALKYPKEYADAVGGAVKEIKNQLLGFDELNILKAPSAGGGGAALDYSSMFENMTLSIKNLDFAKKIKEAIKEARWGDVGKYIAEKFNEMVGSIDAKLFSEELGKKINNAISLVHTLLVEADFHEVGVKIGEFMSNLKLNWAQISGSWIRWKTNILDTLLGLIEGVNWGNVGRSIGNFISGLFNEFSSWLAQVNWYQKGIEFTNAIKSLIANVDWAAVARAIWQALKGALNAALGLLNGALSQVEFDRYGQASLTSTNPYNSSSNTSGAVAGALAGVPRNPDPMGLFANGGYPRMGSVFVAGEQGAELVGQIGGRTGVMNADQMANSLANANEMVVETLVSVGNAIVGAINRKDMSLNINDVRRALNSSNLRYGV